ncbi:MAG: DUF896 domain-containing protein [Eubacteriales bacterium]|nr:DUF896 domain-containing protein [Eubacteriales bacterium]
MSQEQIARINALAKKSRTEEGLTAEEREEQAALRQAYITAFRGSLKAQLDNTVVVRPDGSREQLSQKHLENRVNPSKWMQ